MGQRRAPKKRFLAKVNQEIPPKTVGFLGAFTFQAPTGLGFRQEPWPLLLNVALLTTLLQPQRRGPSGEGKESLPSGGKHRRFRVNNITLTPGLEPHLLQRFQSQHPRSGLNFRQIHLLNESSSVSIPGHVRPSVSRRGKTKNERKP